jgi:hypothetical protein
MKVMPNKKIYSWLTLLFFMIFSIGGMVQFPAAAEEGSDMDGGTGGAGTSVFSTTSSAIDYSFANTGGGFGVGTPTECYRYQTFTATQTGTLEDISVWLNKRYEARDQIQPISDLIIEIYRTEQSGSDVVPVGSALKSVTIPKENLTFTVPPSGDDHAVGGEFTFSIGCPGIEEGERYAVALTQETLAPGDTEGEHYRWPTGDVQAAKATGEHFGKASPYGWADESFLGTGWLKVILSDKVNNDQRPAKIDLSPKGFVYIPVGETLQPGATVYDQNNDEMTGVSLAWTSDKPGVASVDPATGLITGASSGKATVSVRAGTVLSRLFVEVYDSVPNKLAGPANITVKAGDSAALDYEVMDDMKNIRPMLKGDIEYEIEDSGIAVIEGGAVEGIAPGSTGMAVRYGSLVKYVNVSVYEDSEELTVPQPGMVITDNVKFKPGEYDFTGSEGIIIGADGITVDGNGAVIRHSGGFDGSGIYMEGRTEVTIRNINVHGFNTGIYVNGGENLLIEYSDFSDNYNDPSYGWGNGEPYRRHQACKYERQHGALQQRQ